MNPVELHSGDPVIIVSEVVTRHGKWKVVEVCRFVQYVGLDRAIVNTTKGRSQTLPLLSLIPVTHG